MLDLDWEKNASQSSSAKNASSAGGPTSTYNFEALTRSMPSRSTPNSNSRTPPNVSINGNKAVPHVTDKNNNDAFSSLLAFGSSESGAKSNASSMTMAERLQKEKASQSFTGTQNTSKVDAWEGLDDFLKPSSTNVSRQSSNQGEKYVADGVRDMSETDLVCLPTVTIPPGMHHHRLRKSQHQHGLILV